jgi:HAD superfamily hydrolase (TIGR01662 family)
MNKVQAVVFDIGETLIDESRMWRMWADRLRVSEQVFLETLRGTIERGEHHHRAFELLQPGFDLESAREQRRAAGIPDEFDASDLYADAPECLHALRKRGIRIGIAGNQPASAERMLRDLSLPVDFVASSERWGVEKPSPVFFQRIIDEMKIPAGAIAYVGDRLDNDILPAVETGMTAVFVRRGPWGMVHARRAEVARAHLCVESLRDLPEALDAYYAN